MTWFDKNFFYWLIVELILFLAIIFIFKRGKFTYFYSKLKSYKGIQKIHTEEIPRLGGVGILFSLAGYALASDDVNVSSLYKLIIASFIPALFFSFKEDLCFNVKPFFRFIALLISAFLFLNFNTYPLPDLSEISIFHLNKNIYAIFFIVFLLGIVSISNAMNMIDGVNGLCGAISLSILATLLMLSSLTADYLLLSTIFPLMLLIVVFMFFNYPKGHIFLGDTGAYFLGFLISILTIIFFGRHQEISPWLAILILIYPITEIAFSTFRRLINNLTVYKADKDHLHTKFFIFFRANLRRKAFSNPLVMPALSILWIFPSWASLITYKKPIYIFVSILIFFTVYFLAYKFLSEAKKIDE
jgi:UDP-GlcNAc:undecaprenyl-phosphate GlcNAc-1-phosphate transferase